MAFIIRTYSWKKDINVTRLREDVFGKTRLELRTDFRPIDINEYTNAVLIRRKPLRASKQNSVEDI